jgi:hypothetical protein
VDDPEVRRTFAEIAHNQAMVDLEARFFGAVIRLGLWVFLVLIGQVLSVALLGVLIWRTYYP